MSEWEEEMKADHAQDMQDAREEEALHSNFDFAMQRLVLESEELEIIQQALADIQKRLTDYGWEVTNKELWENI